LGRTKTFRTSRRRTIVTYDFPALVAASRALAQPPNGSSAAHSIPSRNSLLRWLIQSAYALPERPDCFDIDDEQVRAAIAGIEDMQA
jgi:hypothetical protein